MTVKIKLFDFKCCRLNDTWFKLLNKKYFNFKYDRIK